MPCEAAEKLFRDGNSLFGAGDYIGAADCYRRAVDMEPGFAAASFNLGCATDRVAGPAEALPHFARAAALRSDWCEARSNLGFALARVGRMAEAAAELEAAAALKPGDGRIRNDLGLALSALGRGDEAFANFTEAIRLNPLFPEPHNNLAVLYERYGRPTEAISSCLEALRLRPEYPEAHNNLGGALKSQGRHAEAIAHLREAIRLRPGFSEAHSSLLFSLCYPADVSEEEIFAAHRAFGAAHRRIPVRNENDPSPERPLRIGYVSADFRSHAVARFIEPVLRHHDRSRFRIFCYSNVSAPDARSAAIAGLCDRFVNIAGLPDAAAEKVIRADGIDILVDLSGHTAENRLPLFARKPAPVQVTWLGYPHTTGLDAIDYRIADQITDPPGDADRLHTEKLLRLPGSFSCFAPDEDVPEVGELPALSGGALTFGSFNNPAKITPETVALWAAALHAVPGARMLVKGYSLADAGSRERLAALFAGNGIAAERLELVGNTPSYRDHLALYRRVDIALDTFPYHGTTTTCEALWMGVPVVTLAGKAHRSRVGASLLSAVGLEYLVAGKPEDFGRIAAALACDLERLQGLRKTLRPTMAASRLTDCARFTAGLESAYREIWRGWCGNALSVASMGTSAQASLPLQGGGQVGDGGSPTSPASSAGPHPHPGPPLEGEGALGADHVANGNAYLQRGMLDRAFREFLTVLRTNGDRSALGGIEQILHRQTHIDFCDALDRDAVRLGAAPAASAGERIGNATLEDAAELLLAMGLVTPAELLCRYLQDRGHRSPARSSIHGEVATRIGIPSCAAGHFRDAIAAGDTSLGARIRLLKSEESARLKPQRPKGEKFLLVKAWGYGFWSDVNHVLGQLLVAELTGRTPVVHWGGNSLFSDDPAANAFESFFEPVSRVSLSDLSGAKSLYPPKWHPANLGQATLNQAEGAWSRISSLHVLERDEEVVVSDFHYAVNDLVDWIPPGHHLHGLTTDQVYHYLFRRYLRVQPAIQAKADEFFGQRMAGRVHLALHVRGGDKGGEDPNLARLNRLYHPEVERFLKRAPDARLYLMTDDSEILRDFRERYGDRVLTTQATRTDNAQGVHYQNHSSRYRLAEEVIVDTLLALRCEAFVGNGLSNVSCAVAQMKEWAPGTLTLLGARLDRLRQFTLYRN